MQKIHILTLPFLFLSLSVTAIAQDKKDGKKAESASNKPNVVILATGGTIAGAQPKPGDYGYKSGEFKVEDLINAVPGAEKFANIKGEQVVNIGSQDMDNATWLKLANKVNEVAKRSDVDGI